MSVVGLTDLPGVQPELILVLFFRVLQPPRIHQGVEQRVRAGLGQPAVDDVLEAERAALGHEVEKPQGTPRGLNSTYLVTLQRHAPLLPQTFNYPIGRILAPIRVSMSMITPAIDCARV